MITIRINWYNRNRLGEKSLQCTQSVRWLEHNRMLAYRWFAEGWVATVRVGSNPKLNISHEITSLTDLRETIALEAEIYLKIQQRKESGEF